MKKGRHDLLIASGGRSLRAHLVASEGRATATSGGVLFVHGWASDLQHYQDLSEEVAALGRTCMAFDLAGHGPDDAEQSAVSRADNLGDVLAAYDALAGWPGVNPEQVVIVGTSYGGYLATIASALRPVRSLALRVPALYPDAQWDAPKSSLSRRMLDQYRGASHAPDGNRALEACQAFKGDVLVVASEHDEVLPLPSVQRFVSAFGNARALKTLTIAGADHALTDGAGQASYAAMLLEWLRRKSKM